MMLHACPFLSLKQFGFWDIGHLMFISWCPRADRQGAVLGSLALSRAPCWGRERSCHFLAHGIVFQ
ncbi:hypothetical protein [Maribacter sp. 2307ULW6-5]|uniref:hypothetical protein n=1 Tax=Maribacter sp. 2307ULW6-5 TaxID=3386275 RepID=UPI0039BC4CC1